MRTATSLVVVVLALAAGSAAAQNITILDQNGQQHEVPQQEFQVVGPHPGVIDVDHLHAQNGVFVRDINNQLVDDPSPDPNGTGYVLAGQGMPSLVAPDPVTIQEGLAQLGRPGQLLPLVSDEPTVDSFFEIVYRIDFMGAPGGPFGGAPTTTAVHESANDMPIIPPSEGR